MECSVAGAVSVSVAAFLAETKIFIQRTRMRIPFKYFKEHAVYQQFFKCVVQ